MPQDSAERKQAKKRQSPSFSLKGAHLHTLSVAAQVKLLICHTSRDYCDRPQSQGKPADATLAFSFLLTAND